MKCDRILNTAVIHAIAAIGHTQTLVICDAGLPVPKGVPCIDLALVHGIPSFQDVLNAVVAEMVVEKVVMAGEALEKNPRIVETVRKALPDVPVENVPHEQFKALTQQSVTIIRSGECTPYANVLLVAGVNF